MSSKRVRIAVVMLMAGTFAAALVGGGTPIIVVHGLTLVVAVLIAAVGVRRERQEG